MYSWYNTVHSMGYTECNPRRTHETVERIILHMFHPDELILVRLVEQILQRRFSFIVAFNEPVYLGLFQENYLGFRPAELYGRPTHYQAPIHSSACVN